jgi:hypothetical protein
MPVLPTVYSRVRISQLGPEMKGFRHKSATGQACELLGGPFIITLLSPFYPRSAQEDAIKLRSFLICLPEDLLIISLQHQQKQATNFRHGRTEASRALAQP